MSTADYALLVSLFSAAVSLGGFVWNVWSKFIYPRPRVRVSFALSFIVADGAKDKDEVIALHATNMGPTEVTVSSALIRKKKREFWRRGHDYGLLNPLHNFPVYRNLTIGPFGGGLPKKLAVGEQFSLYFVPVHEGLADKDIERVGVNDTFGRIHWASYKDTLETLMKVRKRYADSLQSAPSEREWL